MKKLFFILLIACNSLDKATAQKAQLYFQHGTTLLDDENYNEALISLQKAHELSPKDATIMNNLGMAYHFKDRDDLAIPHLINSIKIGNNIDAKNNLATIYMQKKDYVKAESLYKDALEDLTYGYKFKVYYNLGVLELSRHNHNKAVDYLKLSLKEFPNYCAAHYKLGEIAESRRDYRSAYQKYYDASKGTCINDPDPLIKQAEVLVRLKQKDLAISKLELVMQNFTDTPYYHTAKKMLEDLNVTSFRGNSF
jgi:Flp pilus assembly protein TadD